MRCRHGTVIHFRESECEQCYAEMRAADEADAAEDIAAEARKQTEILQDIQRMLRERQK